MPRVSDVVDALEQIAPSRFAFSFDKVGLQVGDPAAPISRLLVSLDRSRAAVQACIDQGAQMLVSHHPLIFQPLDKIVADQGEGGTVLELARHNIAFAAAHTNWDCAPGGINDVLANALGLQSVAPFGASTESPQLKMAVFCPQGTEQTVIDAAAGAGAGTIGNYSRCAFLSPGTGTFLGGEGSHPAIGSAGNIESVPEVRVEMVLPASARLAVESAVRAAHPYEEPAIDWYLVTPQAGYPLGRVGELPAPLPLGEFSSLVDRALATRCWTWGDPSRLVRRVAVVGGAADGEWRAAHAAGADVFLTGEVKQHVALEAAEAGMPIVAAGHYATENPGSRRLAERLAHLLPEVDVRFFVPEPGFSGRPI